MSDLDRSLRSAEGTDDVGGAIGSIILPNRPQMGRAAQILRAAPAHGPAAGADDRRLRKGTEDVPCVTLVAI